MPLKYTQMGKCYHWKLIIESNAIQTSWNFYYDQSILRFVTEEISFITNNEIIIKKNEIDE